MEEFQGIPQPEAPNNNAVALFLGLYLLMLAFFILLVTISTREEVKSMAVMESLSSTFATVLPPSTNLTAFSTKEGNVLASESFQDVITGIFSTAIQIAKIDVVRPGRLMRVAFPSDALFFSGIATLREGRFPMLDRIVAALSARPPGVRYDLEMVIGGRAGADDAVPAGQSLEFRRAAAFAKDMEVRGAPPDSIVVGINTINPGNLVIRFFVHDADEVAAGLKGLGQGNQP